MALQTPPAVALPHLHGKAVGGIFTFLQLEHVKGCGARVSRLWKAIAAEEVSGRPTIWAFDANPEGGIQAFKFDLARNMWITLEIICSHLAADR